MSSTFKIESDWSAVGYWLSMAVLVKGKVELKLQNLFKGSFQGDSKIVEIIQKFGIECIFDQDCLIAKKDAETKAPEFLEMDFSEIPDQGQTIIVLCAATSTEARFTGLESLVIKETNRLKAMQTEIAKIGVMVEIDEIGGTCFIAGGQKVKQPTTPFETYEDHRMAMALSIFGVFFPEGVEIAHPSVVKKSYPEFWSELERFGFNVTVS